MVVVAGADDWSAVDRCIGSDLFVARCSAMDTYATCIGTDGTPDEYTAIAHFYETKSEFAKVRITKRLFSATPFLMLILPRQARDKQRRS